MGSFARWMGRGNHRLSISNKSLSGVRKTEGGGGGGLPLLPQGGTHMESAGTPPPSEERQPLPLYGRGKHFLLEVGIGN